MRKLHITANEAIYSAIEAKNMLLHIYLFLEPGHFYARPLAEEQAERLKKRSSYKYLQGVTYIRLDLDSEYREVVDLLSFCR